MSKLKPCPYRVHGERRASLTIEGEYFYNEYFMPCMRQECACFHTDCDEAYCDRNGAYMKLGKTEPSNSEKPNNYCDDCLYTDTCDSKEFFYACTSKATISKMEQVDKDMNVRSKDEPKTQTKTQNSNLTFEKADEPQTETCKGCKHKNGPFCTVDGDCKYFDRYEPKDEPQTERSE